MNWGFHPAAEEELFAAIDFYETLDDGLGLDLWTEVHGAIRMILANPNAWPLWNGDIRRCFTGRFPYSVLYMVENDQVIILAVMNQHRHPDYWKQRIDRS